MFLRKNGEMGSRTRQGCTEIGWACSWPCGSTKRCHVSACWILTPFAARLSACLPKSSQRLILPAETTWLASRRVKEDVLG